MPSRSRCVCQHPGCGLLIERPGKCATHKKVESASRGSASERGYNSRWQKARIYYLRAHPLCVYCQRDGVVRVAVVVDHIIPHQLKQAIDSGNLDRIARARELFWNSGNWQALCKFHHDSTKQAEESLAGYR